MLPTAGPGQLESASMAATVLVVDDEARSRGFCVEVLEGFGFALREAESAERALAVLESEPVNIVLTDVQMPGANGMELLKKIKRTHPEVEVLVMTGHGSIPQAVEAVKHGAYDYITKPVALQGLKLLFERLAAKQEVAAENRVLRQRVKGEGAFEGLVGNSPKMQRIYQIILKVAEKRHPVLILGESGTGKEVVARAIHKHSPWREKPFVPVDCGALTATLIESELFGHVKGAFTGATQSRAGLLSAASGGTVFLDEIGELPIELQSKLLRALQEREIRPLGSNEAVPLEARILAATNANLESAIKEGKFRSDLYFRLNVVSIKLPPLRERRDEIPALVRCFLERHRAEGSVTGLSAEVMDRLVGYDWPGNVRELENCIQRAIALGTGPLMEMNDLPSSILQPAEARPEVHNAATLRALERKAILQALETAGGDRVRAAQLLGIGKTTIYRKLKEYGLETLSH